VPASASEVRRLADDARLLCRTRADQVAEDKATGNASRTFDLGVVARRQRRRADQIAA
jgi:hypothetical protein